MIALFDYAIPYVQGRSDVESRTIAATDFQRGDISTWRGWSNHDAGVRLPTGWRLATTSECIAMGHRRDLAMPRLAGFGCVKAEETFAVWLVYTFVITDEPEAG